MNDRVIAKSLIWIWEIDDMLGVGELSSGTSTLYLGRYYINLGERQLFE